MPTADPAESTDPADFPALPPRRLIAVCGDADDGRRAAGRLLAGFPPAEVCRLTVGDDGLARLQRGSDGTPSRPALAALGSECTALVVDAHSGFDPDAVGQCAGSVRAGGVLLLLAPPPEHWPSLADPVRRRCHAHGDDASGPDRYLLRLARLLGEAGMTIRVPESPPPAALPYPAPVRHRPPDRCASADQAAAVDDLLRLAHGRAQRPLLLCADRGRGKSAALGLAAAALLAEGWPRVVVTGPRLDATAAVFAHAAAALPAAAGGRGRLTLADGGVLEFIAPDALAAPDAPAVPLLLVDEAAALPGAVLARLLDRHPRIAFASTVHGYEGSGRGFALRFRARLDARTPQWRERTLTTPIRWPAGDPLEAVLARWLLLDAEPAAVAAVTGVEAITIRGLDRDRLVHDEALLANVHGLLVAAHYRTTPLDLRQWLDGPNLQVYAALGADGAPLGVLLAADEGGFAAPLAADVYAGRRRPRGHLIPQSLAQHLGIEHGATCRCARIVRIAVHAAMRGRGIGSALLAALADDGRRRGFDLLGTSFAAEAGVLRFWQRAGLRPVRIGSRRDTAGGAPALMLLQPLSAAGAAMFAPLPGRFAADLPLLLAGPHAGLEAPIAAALLAAAGKADAADAAHTAATVTAFAAGARDLASAWPALWRTAAAALADAEAPLSADERALLVAALLQHQPWPTLVCQFGESGRAALEARLRQVFARLAAGAAAGGK